MRIWLIDPKQMSDQHLLGQHNEIHMLDSMFKNPRYKNHRMVAWWRERKGWLKEFHDQLVEEMDFRFNHIERNGGKHPTPFPRYRKNSDWSPVAEWVAYDQTDMASRWWREPEKYRWTKREKAKFRHSRVRSPEAFINRFGQIPAHVAGAFILGVEP